MREWRREFARHLREQGIAANATERFVRGETKSHKLDGIYRPMHDAKRYSMHVQARRESVATDLRAGHLRVEAGKTTLVQTRKVVARGWQAVSERLASEGHAELAAQVRRYVDHMPSPQTERELIARDLQHRAPEVDVRPERSR